MFNPQDFVNALSSHPGVYCMRDRANKPLYVGKAKNLKNRVGSYFKEHDDPRINQLVSQIANIDITITSSEKEALLLENSLIKALKPRYNVIFRDDKSYPYLFLSEHPFPRLVYFRGKQKLAGQYYGPYPSSIAVKETLTVLQKLFKIRQCDDLFFSNRSRPCLQYQIGRCSAPCVKYVTQEDYHLQVNNVELFLKGKETSIINDLVKKMELASQTQEFEEAAALRDQIMRLRVIHEQQVIYRQQGNADVIAVGEHKGHFCIQLLYIRQGRILDTQTYFPKQVGEGTRVGVLRGFLTQLYLNQEDKLDYPHEILLNENIEDESVIAEAMSSVAKHRIKIYVPQKGEKVKWLTLASENAAQALNRKISQSTVMTQRWFELKKVLGLNQNLTRIECFDISHTQGEATIASCVVFDVNGPTKAEYRRYNMDVPANDDYAAMEQALTKRYLKRKAEELPLPDLILIDGGKGQLHRAKKALLECQILDVLMIGIAKGEGRKPGLETLYLTRSQSDEEFIINLPPTSSALHLLQQIRDEAHRFAITGHRQKRAKARKHSPLEEIPGIGLKRRQALINYFGGYQALVGASQEAIAKVPGISAQLAAKIYIALHP
ncbi:excinuclease ABC subunit UvrC [Candidatus Berkiella aquae]|uniref:UvrABC system protein C n=1 Tax=Candidatus Berkiella aquae TaxID=295108 RepID=A0A0Q9YEE7_9GAMM|nr:excinuclease ABC subunit UvrC [Candidatus Berkiella aquae]MCS5711654.1 excinuclease ABC subunit UvrC [Candidatus Berkiella aquae]